MEGKEGSFLAPIHDTSRETASVDIVSEWTPLNGAYKSYMTRDYVRTTFTKPFHSLSLCVYHVAN